MSHYPKVYVGGFETGIEKTLTGLPAYIAGFGSTIPTGYPLEPTSYDGNRRWGQAPIDLAGAPPDPCGDIGEQYCHDDWEWEADRIANPQTEKGDSGGPLVMSDSEGAVIAGVFSGAYQNGWPQDTTPRSVWAPTGSPGGTKNGVWILNNCLGGDADADGVADAVDNCPPWWCANQNKPASDCTNADQADTDGDGVGEKCDNCPQALCDNLAAIGQLPQNVTCSNPSQTNIEHDSRGDACDLCPETSAGDPFYPLFPETAVNPEADSDSDGIGDACDFCDQYDPYAACTYACTNGSCLVEPNAASGHCSLESDADYDGIPDACDDCAGFVSKDNTNSNSIAEDREQLFDPPLPKLADVCDPVPIVRVPQQKIEPITSKGLSQLTPGDGKDADDVALIPEDRWLGVDAGKQAKLQTFERQVQYLQCTCVDESGAPTSLESCVKPPAPMPCPLWDPQPGLGSPWRVPSVTDSSGAPDPTSGLTGLQDFDTNQSKPDTLTWQWRKDVLAGTVTGLGTCPGTGPLDCKTHGALVTRTKKAAPYASTREENHVLGDVFQMIDTPALQQVPDQPPNICPAPCLKGFVHPDYLKDPDPYGFTALFDRPTPVVPQSSGIIAAFLSPTHTLDITSYVDPTIRQIILSGTLWLNAVEPAAVARASGSIAVAQGVHAVLLSPDYTGASPLRVMMNSYGMFTATEVVIDPPPVLHGVKGAYSAVESSIYMVGGTLDSGQASNRIWRWSLLAQDWQTVENLGRFVPSSRVLSVGYIPSGQHLYVIDLDDDDRFALPHSTHEFARLYRIDLAKGDSTLLARYPFTGQAYLTAIAVMPDGTLALVSAAKDHYSVSRFDVSGTHAIFKGVLTGQGHVSDPPVMGEDRLWLAVEKAGSIDMIDLGVERFHGGPPLSSL